MEGEILLQYFLISSQRRNGYVQHRPRRSPFHPQATPKPFHPPSLVFGFPPFRVWTLPPFCPPPPSSYGRGAHNGGGGIEKGSPPPPQSGSNPPPLPLPAEKRAENFAALEGEGERETGKEVQRGRRYHLTSSFRSFLHTTSLFCPQGEEGPPNGRRKKTRRKKREKKERVDLSTISFHQWRQSSSTICHSLLGLVNKLWTEMLRQKT